MMEQGETNSKIPRIFDSACSTRLASELVCISGRIYCTFQSIDWEDLRERNILLAAWILPGAWHRDIAVGEEAPCKAQEPKHCTFA